MTAEKPVEKPAPRVVENPAITELVEPVKVTKRAVSDEMDDAAWQEVLGSIKSKHNTLYGITRMAVPVFDGDKLVKEVFLRAVCISSSKANTTRSGWFRKFPMAEEDSKSPSMIVEESRICIAQPHTCDGRGISGNLRNGS